MSTKREEERNEKIIRGLMKLPPNRRCINCNSLGPQYVCINFWTFVCMTCSGIHREFTHRVKSVSMSKFTSQEVEVLQKGGNQRAREIFLKNWDSQGQRLPNGSDVEKVREFIKNVYVHRKFAGGKNSEKPPRDMQSHQGSSEEEMRRASSYHSFSQSPPYDFQYEERQNRKQGAILSRKPGSDRVLYERKVSSFVYSPGHSSEHAYEDRFANEGTSSRVSDYSVSSGGDPFRSAPQSPNSQKDAGFSSPTVDPLGGIFVDHAVQQEINLYSGAHPSGANILPFPQRTTSGSLGSFDSYSVSLKPADCRSLFPSVSEPDQSVPIHQDKAATVSSFVDSSASVDSNALDLFKQPIGLQSVSSPIDLFQLPPEASISSTDIFRPATDSAAISSVYSSQSCPSSSLNLFNAVSQEPLQANMNERLFEPSASNNEGWATFDLPEHSASSLDKQDFSIAGTESAIGNSALTFNPLSSSSTSMQWPEFPSSLAHGWHEDLHNVQVPSKSLSSQDPRGAGQETGCSTGDALPTLLSNVTTESSSDQDVLLFMAEVQPQIEQKSGNPFDILYDSELEASNAFLDMSSLTAVLPSSQLPSSFVGSIDESWFAPNTPSPCAPDAAQAGLSYMSTQAPGSPLQNVPAYGSVASLGGNPFA